MKQQHRDRKIRTFQSFSRHIAKKALKDLEGFNRVQVRQTGKTTMQMHYLHGCLKIAFDSRINVAVLKSGGKFRRYFK